MARGIVPESVAETAGGRSLGPEEDQSQETADKVNETVERRSQPMEWLPLRWVTQDQRYVARSFQQWPRKVSGERR